MSTCSWYVHAECFNLPVPPGPYVSDDGTLRVEYHQITGGWLLNLKPAVCPMCGKLFVGGCDGVSVHYWHFTSEYVQQMIEEGIVCLPN